MKITSTKKLGLASIAGGGLLAAVLSFAAPAQADLGHSQWAHMQNSTSAAVAICGAVASAANAGADTNPLVPYGPGPQVPTSVGMSTSNHDEIDTTNGQLDLPF